MTIAGCGAGGHLPDDTEAQGGHNEAVSYEASYRERVLPGPLWWITVGALVAMLSIAYGAALGSYVGVVVAIVAGVLAIVGLWASSPVLEVTPAEFRAGRARLPRPAWGAAEVLSATDLIAVRRGQHAHVATTAYLMLPSWAPRRAVSLQVEDAADPHRTWVVATRHPDRLRGELESISTRGPG